jgi:hypothetical protein
MIQGFNHTLTRVINNADGTYLNDRDLQSLEQYSQSYVARLETYQQLQEHSPQLIQQALRKLAQVHPELIQQYGQRCVYDMTEVVRYIALSVLRDDESFFREQMLSWLDTILLAHKRNEQCAIAYRYLQEAIQSSLPNSRSSLLRPYLDIVIQALQSHA